MKLIRKLGATSQILQVFIADTSSATGGGLAGLVFNTASLTAYYHRDTDTTATAITLVTMTVGTFTSSGFKEIDATNMPGWYQLCPPNAALASGAASVALHLKGATNMAPLPIEIDLDAQVDVTSWNGTAVASPATAGIPDVNAKNINNVATTSVTTINANQGTTQPLNFTGTAGSALVKSDMVDIAGAAVSTTSAQIGVNVVQVNAQTATAAAGVTFPSSIASPTNITAGTMTNVTNLTNAATSGDFTATMKTSLNAATPASIVGAVGSVTGNVGGNVTGSIGSLAAQAQTDAAGSIWNAVRASYTTSGTFGGDTVTPPTNFSSLSIDGSGRIDLGKVLGTASPATAGYVALDWGQVTNKTTTNVLTGTTIATSQVVASVTGAVGSVTGLTASNLDTTISSRMASYTQPTGFLAATFPSGTIANTTNIAAGTVTTATNVTNISAGGITGGSYAAWTEAYTTLGTAASYRIDKMIFDIHRRLYARAVSSTTETVYAMDGTTAEHTITLNSATTPTSAIQAT